MSDQRFSLQRLEIVKGVEGLAVYLNGLRIAGPKPWGGGKIIATWNVDLAVINESVRCGGCDE